jgi:hypothetical protein
MPFGRYSIIIYTDVYAYEDSIIIELSQFWALPIVLSVI